MFRPKKKITPVGHPQRPDYYRVELIHEGRVVALTTADPDRQRADEKADELMCGYLHIPAV